MTIVVSAAKQNLTFRDATRTLESGEAGQA